MPRPERSDAENAAHARDRHASRIARDGYDPLVTTGAGHEIPRSWLRSPDRIAIPRIIKTFGLHHDEAARELASGRLSDRCTWWADELPTVITADGVGRHSVDP